MQMNVHGWLPDPPDSRDWVYQGAKPMRSKGDHANPFLPPIVRSQVGGACVANAWCNAAEMLALKEGLSYLQLSEHGFYWQLRKWLGVEGTDSGSYNRLGASALRTQGVGQAIHWPSKQETLFEKPDAVYWGDAFDSMLSEHYRIVDDGLDPIENAVRANLPVVVGLLVGSDFASYFNAIQDAVFDPPDPATALGGHAMVVVGVRGEGEAREFKLLNSWGPNFGRNGSCWISARYMQTAQDMWVGTRSPL